MPSLWIRFNPKVGPILQVSVWKPGFVPPQGSPAAPTNANLYNALLDTGASCSCVSDKVIKTELLVPSGKQQVGGVNGSQSTNAYRFQIAVPFVQGQNAAGSFNANFMV
jgi:hypothetical protein